MCGAITAVTSKHFSSIIGSMDIPNHDAIYRKYSQCITNELVA